MNKLYLLLFFAIFCISCNHIEIKREFYKNGTLKAEYQTKNNKFHGYYKSFSNDGILLSEGCFNENKFDNTWKYWYENGKIMSIQIFDKGKLLNINFWSRDNNHLVIDGDGTGVYYDPKGIKIKQFTYKQNLRDSIWITWHNNGNIESKMQFSRDKQVGIVEYFDSNGIRIFEDIDETNQANPVVINFD